MSFFPIVHELHPRTVKGMRRAAGSAIAACFLLFAVLALGSQVCGPEELPVCSTADNPWEVLLLSFCSLCFPRLPVHQHAFLPLWLGQQITACCLLFAVWALDFRSHVMCCCSSG